MTRPKPPVPLVMVVVGSVIVLVAVAVGAFSGASWYSLVIQAVGAVLGLGGAIYAYKSLGRADRGDD